MTPPGPGGAVADDEHRRDPGRAGAGDVGRQVVADVDRGGGRDAAGERERPLEDRRRGLGGARLGRGDRAVEQRRQPGLRQRLVQRDVPVADDDQPQAGGAQRAERRGHLGVGPEAQAGQQRPAQVRRVAGVLGQRARPGRAVQRSRRSSSAAASTASSWWAR